MMEFRDMFCDACLYKVESLGEVLVDDLCDRCREKLHDWFIEFFSEVEEAQEEHERLLERWKS